MSNSWTREELEQLNWTDLREIAESLGIPKPDEGWKAAIPLILQNQQQEEFISNESPIIENPQPTDEPLVLTTSVIEEPLKEFLTEVESPLINPETSSAGIDYSGWFPKYPPGIPVCPRCGSKKLTDDSNQVICAVNDAACPLI